MYTHIEHKIIKGQEIWYSPGFLQGVTRSVSVVTILSSKPWLFTNIRLCGVCVCVRERERQRDRERGERERDREKETERRDREKERWERGERGSGFLYSQSLLPESNQWGHGEELHSHVASLHRRKQHLTKQHITRSINPHLSFLPPSLPRYYERLTQTSWLCESATKFLSSSE